MKGVAMTMKMNFGAFMAGVSLLFFALPASAHHGFDTEYDANKKLTLRGVVTKVEWLNPSTGAVTNGGTVNGGSASQSFTPPFSGDAVLYLVDALGHN